MLNIHSMQADELPCYLAEQCRNLCHADSEMQGLFDRIALLEMKPRDYTARIAYCWVTGGDDEGPVVVGWASVWDWVVGDEVRVQAQGFVSEDYRKQGIATALCVCLTHGMSKDSLPVAVFSPEFRSIAKRLGWRATEYRLVHDGWIGVGSVGRRAGRRGADEGRVHAAAPEVRGVPLARRKTGETP